MSAVHRVRWGGKPDERRQQSARHGAGFCRRPLPGFGQGRACLEMQACSAALGCC